MYEVFGYILEATSGVFILFDSMFIKYSDKSISLIPLATIHFLIFAIFAYPDYQDQ